ncbi:HEAT repeat-containing protein, partial [Cardiosporidium cionae]
MFSRLSKSVEPSCLFDVDEKESINLIQDLSRTSLLQVRVSQTRRILESAYEVDFEVFKEKTVTLVYNMSKDDLPAVRQEICRHLGDLAGFLIQKDPEEGSTCVISSFLPLVKTFLKDTDSRVRESACEALVNLSAHLRWRSLSPVLSLVLSVIHGSDGRDVRCVASALMNGLAITVGRDICLSFFVPQIQCLAEDSDPYVRRSVVENLLEVCNAIGENATSSKLLPTYRKLCKDSEWIIRRSVTENLPNFLMTIKPSLRCSFINTLKDLLNDVH